MDTQKIANLIKTRRKAKNLTQAELASKLGVTEKAVSRWETGRGTPDISILLPLAQALDTSVSEILNGEENLDTDKDIQNIVAYLDENQKKQKFVLPIVIGFYTIFLLFYLWYLKIDYQIQLSYFKELLYNAGFISFIFVVNNFLAANCYDKVETKMKLRRLSYTMALLIYSIMLLNLTVFARFLGSYAYNLVPFKTIVSYFAFPNFKDNLINIWGNILIMMPLEFFIIKVFKTKKYLTSLLIGFTFILLIELIQFFGQVGVFDVDDIILNLFGMSLMYFLVTKRFNFLFKHKLFFITSVMSLTIIFFTYELFSWYHFLDIPSKNVLFRIAIGYLILEIVLYFIGKRLLKAKEK